MMNPSPARAIPAAASAAVANAADDRRRREVVRAGGAEFAVFPLAGESDRRGPLLIWAHGWGHTHDALLPLAESMRDVAPSWLVDLPGFGESPLPPAVWGTADYADAMAEWLAGLGPSGKIWVAHSFGCRVGLQLAARHPRAVDGLFLIAAAGLPPQHSPATRARLMARRLAFRLARSVTPEGPARDRLRHRFGSADYRRAGTLRPILVKTVGEDLSAAARAVRVPAALVYGERDRETPPEIGRRLQALMPQAQLYVLRGFDHWTVLTEGRHQLAHRLGEFVAGLTGTELP